MESRYSELWKEPENSSLYQEVAKLGEKFFPWYLRCRHLKSPSSSRVTVAKGPQIWLVVTRICYMCGSLYRENLYGVCYSRVLNTKGDAY